MGGIDLLSFTTTPRFQGIKGIPPGFHFIFTSPTTALSVRHGAWFHVGEPSSPSSNFWIKKWDSSREELVSEDDQASILRWRANIGSIWKGLTPYRQSASGPSNEPQEGIEISKAWTDLTSYITPSLLARITGGPQDHWNLTSVSSASVDVDHIPGLTALESIIQTERELNFVPINLKQTWREGATGRERTNGARDRSWALDDLITRYCADQSELEILGELQFCFLMVLTLNNNSCLEQWKRILSLLCTCRGAVLQRPQLFVNLMTTISLQLKHAQEAEGGLFNLHEDDGELIRNLLRDFKRGLEQEDGSAKEKIVGAFGELEEFIRTEFGWELQHDFVRNGILELEDGERVEMDIGGDEEADELGEYAPMVVELTPEQVKNLDSDLSAKPSVPLHLRTGYATHPNEDEEDQSYDYDIEESDLENMDSRY
ncbi:MAG: hypothetical protein Q9157_002333 [Trypethelium eluteriae]